nr:MAG TPA: hypothetical protein [Caudoviricetes sp.]
MYAIGDIVYFVPEALRYCKAHGYIKTKSVPGVVVWIHPQRRFMVLERRIAPGLCYRESIFIKTGRQNNENNRNHEPKGRRGQDRHSPQFSRSSKRRR